MALATDSPVFDHSSNAAAKVSERVSDVMMPTYAPLPFVPATALGSRLTDTNGTSFIDLAGGIAVNVLGHCHPALVDALTEQALKLWHLSNVFTNEPALRLAERLTEATFADRVFFSNSGAEANEAALKLARRWGHNINPDKFGIVALEKAFHGRTLFTVSTGGTPAYSEGFGPIPGGIDHIPPNDIAALEAAIDANTAAVILEPIVAEGGIIALEPAFLVRARELCDEHGALLIFDEVQTGVYRTGSMYAYMTAGPDGTAVNPDVLTTAKALGGGFPVAATLATEEAASALVRGTHGSTFGGNPLGCAVANAVLTEVEKPEVLANAEARSTQLRAGLQAIADDTGLFSEIRGKGMLIGAAMAPEHLGRAKEFQLATMARGALILVAGPDVSRLTPALNVTEAEANEALGSMALAAADMLTTT